MVEGAGVLLAALELVAWAAVVARAEGTGPSPYSALSVAAEATAPALVVVILLPVQRTLLPRLCLRPRAKPPLLLLLLLLAC